MYSRKKRAAKKPSLQSARTGSGWGVRGGVWQKTTLFPDFFSEAFPLGRVLLFCCVQQGQRIKQIYITFTFSKITHLFITPFSYPPTSETSKWTCMAERRPTVATSVATQASELLLWKDTCWFTVERNLLFVNGANTPTHKLVSSKDTCWPIQVKSPSAANSATTPAQQLVTSRDIC